MSIDLSNVIALALGSDDVLQIQDAIGTVLWQKIIYYNVNISAGSNGTVSVNGVIGNYSQSVPSGTVLTIEGTGNTGYDFDEWSDGNTDNPRTITVTGDLTLTASFESAVLPDYFYVEDISGADNTVSITKSDASAPDVTVYYSTDTNNWTLMGTTDVTPISVSFPANGKLYLKATANYWGKNVSWFNNITASGNHNIGGNSMSLFYGDNFANQTTFPTNDEFIFNSLFKNNTTLISAANLQLPSTTLTRGCYYNMFYGCTSLTTTPVLPATTLALQCYNSMFRNCTALTTAPALPATTLAVECYGDMFKNCTALTTAPALPATTLAQSCYVTMFMNCTSLTTAPALPATTLSAGCYNSMFFGCSSLTTAPALPVTTLAQSCYQSMFQGCTSLAIAPALPATTLVEVCYNRMFYGCTSLTTAPALPATTLAQCCYQEMFRKCSSLTTAPELPATTLVEVCYYSMFSGCTSLNQVTTYADNISAAYCLDNWLDNVANTGTFNNYGTATYKSGASGIPTGWTEVKDTYFYIKDVSGSDNTLSIVKESSYTPTITVYKSIDHINWESMGTTSTTAITATVPANGKLYLKATANGWCDNTIQGDRYNTKISASGNHNVGGNIMSLLYGDNFTNQTAFPVQNYGGVFCKLFNNDTTLVNARRLTLPATTIDVDCYYGMFKGCTSLTTSPEALPATTLAIDCYNSMFYGCTSLTSAPTISATTLANRCCNQMFYDCRTLTTAPVLYATTLTTGSYKDMFYNCRLLNSVTTYANDISPTDCLQNWLYNVAPTGDFYNLGNASYTEGASGIPQGWTEHKGTPDEYFWIENPNDNEISVDIQTVGSALPIEFYYSTDKVNWHSQSALVDIEPQSKVYMKANTDKWATSASDYNHFNSLDNINVGGNIMSLLYGDNYKDATAFTTNNTYAFAWLFYGSKVVDASQLKLPTNTVTGCYNGMFKGCTSLTTAPALPATTLANGCYREMFRGCTLLNKIVSYAEDASVTAIKTMKWLYGVSETGDFYNLGNAGYSSGVSGIPTGWTVHTSL